MPTEPPDSLVAEAVRTLEVRWIFPGRLQPAVAGWFGRFPAQTESRQDTYLLDPRLPGLSVKVRGGGALEVKASWQKWSFSFSPPSGDSGEAAGWTPVGKRRRISRFTLASGQVVARAPAPGQQAGCEVELTEVRARGQDWWTLGFEATGPAELLRGALEAAAARVFARGLPGGRQPGTGDSRSYAEWLGQRPGASS
jgi:hypothetical protein